MFQSLIFPQNFLPGNNNFFSMFSDIRILSGKKSKNLVYDGCPDNQVQKSQELTTVFLRQSLSR